jgi:hypothetical protein
MMEAAKIEYLQRNLNIFNGTNPYFQVIMKDDTLPDNDPEPLPFKATIYRIGINLVVDVPPKVTNKLNATKGQIKIQGTINGFAFHTTLMPVKNKPFILYVNMPMLKGTGAVEGEKRYSEIPELCKIRRDFT